MKTSKIILFVVLAAAVAGILIARHQVTRTPAHQAGRETRSPAAGSGAGHVGKSLSASLSPEAVSSDAISNSSETAHITQAGTLGLQTNAQPPTAKALTYNGYEVQDPLARVALYSVGTGDPEADAYWESAVFDPNLPAEERKDLIEDLNETGMADPHHPGPADLPLILARIPMIEQLAPYSIDQVDADAFAEAYKDLVGMANGQAPQ